MSSRRMTYTACTSFSPKGYEIYGRIFLESFLKYWPEDVRLLCVYERKQPDIDDPRIRYLDLWADDGWPAFHEQWKNEPKVSSSHHTWGALKWARKVFALTTEPVSTDWLLWIDADVETVKPIDDSFFREVLPDRKVLSYLNREHWRYSECGFVGYKVADERVRKLLTEMRRMYASGAFRKLAEYGDSYVFDHVRRKLFASGPELHRLVGKNREMTIHVWPISPLGRYMRHFKGASRKLERYGDAI